MQNNFGETALFGACTYGHVETARLLLKRGASVNYQRKVGVLYVYGLPGTRCRVYSVTLEQLRWPGGWDILCSYVHGHHSLWVIDAWRMQAARDKFRPT